MKKIKKEIIVCDYNGCENEIKWNNNWTINGEIVCFKCYQKIDNETINKCKHEYINDEIDYDDDYGKYIRYITCKKCNLKKEQELTYTWKGDRQIMETYLLLAMEEKYKEEK